MSFAWGTDTFEISAARFERFVRISLQVWYARNDSPLDEVDRHSLICWVTANIKAMFNDLAELTLTRLGHMPQIVPRQADIFAYLVSEFHPLLEGIIEHAVSEDAMEATFDWVYQRVETWNAAAKNMIAPARSS